MKNEDVSRSLLEFVPYDLVQNRSIEPAKTGDPQLGPLKMLPGTWANIRVDDRRTDPDGSKNQFALPHC